ncbi:SDR family NAD(P)-dependent oxidoreductase [Ahrensia sp. 13_GOM-1096m]|uniref:SDR family NAD(P)-dependent oxidoreductase n=1 Tax=Ahrensia sp. 13_GOM-1096m TaxID=1380380 RepID=UPI00055694ED|nr:SDR family oxidoreductase [Ahrensia sp. 13_GOM-1096m]
MSDKKVIVVTGASRGLGQYIAQQALATGYEVIGAARSAGEGQGYPIFACDVSDADAVKSFASSVQKQAGKNLYGVINSAGVAAMNLAVTTPTATVRKVIDINLIGSIFMCQKFSTLLMRRKNGRIINFSTIAVPLALSGESVYVASKAGIEGFTRTFAREISGFGLTANCIAPGPIDTDLIAGVSDKSINKIIDRQVVKKKGTKADIWNIVDILLDEKSNMISGQTINVGGV